MAIEFLQAQKKQRYMMLILTFTICAILLVVWMGFFRGEEPIAPVSTSTFIQSEVEINWEALSDEKIEALKTFERIPELKGDVGRENPFANY